MNWSLINFPTFQQMEIDAAVSKIQRLEHSAKARGAALRSLHRFRIVSQLPSKHLDEQLWRNKFLIGTTCIRVLSFESGKFDVRVFSRVWPPPQINGGVKLGAHFGIFGKLIRNFSIPVHWSFFEISERFFFTKLPQIVLEKICGSLRRYPKSFTSNQIRIWPF